MTFQIPSYIDKIQTLADGGNKMSVITQELSPEEMTLLFGLKSKQGWLLFKENPIEASDVPQEEALEFKSDKTPSQRLRSVLYIYWEQNTNKSNGFDLFYKEWMDRKVNEVKDTLK